MSVKFQYYYGYDGSLTHPPCNGDVSWRIIRKPLKIAQKQMDLINKLIAGHINEDCELGTFGKWQNSDSCFVDVTRPVQYTTKEHHLVSITFLDELSTLIITPTKSLLS